MAILATEFVVEIVGQGMPFTNLDILHLPDILTVSAFGPCRIPGIRVLDTLRIDTTPEFPAAPLFPWDP